MEIRSVFRISFLLVSMLFIVITNFAKVTNYHSTKGLTDSDKTAPTPTDGGIIEEIPAKFLQNYQKWKKELLSTEYGRQQWENYSNNKNFILRVTVAKEEKQGAGTGEYVWNEDGKLIGATIVLGWKLDKGFPNPVYFPVMNSISTFNLPGEISGETLAATKFMHEFGHVNITSKTGRAVFQLQNKLIPDYNKILLSNGYNTKDDRLVKLAEQMGGTPVEIWENREYWGEANAMNYLLEKVKPTDYFCPVIKKINYNVVTFADTYKDRFYEIASSKSDLSCWK